MGKSVKINGVFYENVPSVDIPLTDGSGNDATFYDVSDATASAADVLNGRAFYGAEGKVQGSMPDNGAMTLEIESLNDEKTIAAGKHSGLGKAIIKATEKAKIIAENIKSGVTILGVQGKSTVVDTEEAVGATAAQILKDRCAWVNGSRIKGTMTAATVTQDSTSKVLKIS